MDYTPGMEEALEKLTALSDAALVWTVAPAVLLTVLLIMLIVLFSLKSRTRKVERLLFRELEKTGARIAALEKQIMQMSPPRPMRPATAQLPLRPREAPAPPPPDLLPLINDLLAGNQPYNFIEAVRALNPKLQVQRMAPRPRDEFAAELLLDNGGDALFASIQDNAAQLFPNYGRFSATLDPLPLFDGAAHGGRIAKVHAPARLALREDGAWQLIEKGRVQMR